MFLVEVLPVCFFLDYLRAALFETISPSSHLSVGHVLTFHSGPCVRTVALQIDVSTRLSARGENRMGADCARRMAPSSEKSIGQETAAATATVSALGSSSGAAAKWCPTVREDTVASQTRAASPRQDALKGTSASGAVGDCHESP